MDSDKKDFYNTVKLVIGAAIVIIVIGLIVRAYLKAQNQKSPKDERREKEQAYALEQLKGYLNTYCGLQPDTYTLTIVSKGRKDSEVNCALTVDGKEYAAEYRGTYSSTNYFADEFLDMIRTTLTSDLRKAFGAPDTYRMELTSLTCDYTERETRNPGKGTNMLPIWLSKKDMDDFRAGTFNVETFQENISVKCSLTLTAPEGTNLTKAFFVEMTKGMYYLDTLTITCGNKTYSYSLRDNILETTE